MITAVLAGCGAMSAVWFEAIQKVPILQLVGLVDIDRSRAVASAAKFGLTDIEIGTSLDEVLTISKPQVVFDVVVPQARKDLVLTAFRHGCDVLTEKPMAASLDDARAILQATRQSKRIHAVVQNRRYLTNVRRIRRFLEQGALGRPTSIHCDFFIGPHFGGFREEMDHVLLVDMAIHTFDAARYMVNAVPKKVYCQEWEPENSWFKNGSSAIATFKFGNGTVFNYRGSWCAPGIKTSWEGNWRIICERGSLTWDGHEELHAERVTGQKIGILDATETLEVPGLSAEDRIGGHLGVIQDFVAAMASRSAPETAGEDNIKSLAMVFAAVASAERGGLVELQV